MAYRRQPLNVLLVIAGHQLVRVGGTSTLELREDFFDATVDQLHRVRTDYISVYDIALSGGEPYQVWN